MIHCTCRDDWNIMPHKTIMRTIDTINAIVAQAETENHIPINEILLLDQERIKSTLRDRWFTRNSLDIKHGCTWVIRIILFVITLRSVSRKRDGPLNIFGNFKEIWDGMNIEPRYFFWSVNNDRPLLRTWINVNFSVDDNHIHYKAGWSFLWCSLAQAVKQNNWTAGDVSLTRFHCNGLIHIAGFEYQGHICKVSCP